MTDPVPAQAAAMTLPAVLDLGAAAELKERLLAFAGVSRLSIDCSAVERVGTPAIQVLLAASRSAAAEGRSVELNAASPVLREALTDLGLIG